MNTAHILGKKTLQKQKLMHGFTLIELLIVMAIIGILATMLMSNFAGVRERARDARRKSDLDEMKKALRLYYNDFQTYPASGAGGQILGCVDRDDECEVGGEFAYGTTIYMKELPTDPSTGLSYHYTMNSSGENFVLRAEMENAGDAEIDKSRSRCGQGETEELYYYVCAD